MIFGCSFGFFELGVNGQLYKKYPDILFEQATGTQIKKNQSEYFGAGEDTIYLSGMAAGAASKKGLIGYIVPFGIPEVVRHANAFLLGAQATHPGARVKLLWTNAWVSTPKETAAAKSLIAAGVDVLGQNVDTPAGGRRRRGQGRPVGRLRLRRPEDRAEAVADGRDLQLGAVLREAGQGRDERNVEARLLLRHDQGRVHEHRSLRPEGQREDEGGYRGEEEGDRRGQVQRLHRAARTTRRARWSCRREDAQGPSGPVRDAMARRRA